jgi:hypothetical protein
MLLIAPARGAMAHGVSNISLGAQYLKCISDSFSDGVTTHKVHVELVILLYEDDRIEGFVPR